VRYFGLRLLPGGLLLGAASVLLLPELREWVRPVVPVVAFIMTASGIVLGLRFGNIRVVFALVVLALADEAMRLAPTGDPTSAASLGPAVTLLVSLNLAALAWTHDPGARRAQVKLWAPLIAAQVLGVALLLSPEDAEAARVFWRTLLEPVQYQWPVVTALADLTIAAAVGLTVVRFALRPYATEAGIVWAMVAALLALGFGHEHLALTLYFATGGLILIVALVETSYAMVYGDELTGLPARRALNGLLSGLGRPYAVAMVDIDHFKKFNDTYGHQAGDQLLRKVATRLAAVSGGGRSFRYGGEEFAVVFPGHSRDEASRHLEIVREAIAAMSFTMRGADRRWRRRKRTRPAAGSREKVGVTISVGVADSTAAGPTPADVVRAADEALYRAKHAGRNRLAN
jgi:diguanylate cyclase (GGDEF)-like protein